MMRLAGKVAVVTGAAQGIGLAITQRYLADGAMVAMLDIDRAKLAESAATLPADRVLALPLDISKPEQVAATFAAVVARFGRCDVLVNNAAVSFRSSFLDMPADKWARVIDINLNGSFLCGQAAARQMVAQGQGGRIINMASTSGLRGGSARSAYGAAKGGIINLTRAMAVELGEYGILVNAIAPGPVLTAMANHDAVQKQAFLDRMALKRYATPEEIAAVAAFLAGPDSSFITGETISVDGGFHNAGMIMDIKQMAPSAKALP